MAARNPTSNKRMTPANTKFIIQSTNCGILPEWKQ